MPGGEACSRKYYSSGKWFPVYRNSPRAILALVLACIVMGCGASDPEVTSSAGSPGQVTMPNATLGSNVEAKASVAPPASTGASTSRAETGSTAPLIGPSTIDMSADPDVPSTSPQTVVTSRPPGNRVGGETPPPPTIPMVDAPVRSTFACSVSVVLGGSLDDPRLFVEVETSVDVQVVSVVLTWAMTTTREAISMVDGRGVAEVRAPSPVRPEVVVRAVVPQLEGPGCAVEGR